MKRGFTFLGSGVAFGLALVLGPTACGSAFTASEDAQATIPVDGTTMTTGEAASSMSDTGADSAADSGTGALDSPVADAPADHATMDAERGDATDAGHAEDASQDAGKVDGCVDQCGGGRVCPLKETCCSPGTTGLGGCSYCTLGLCPY